METTEVMTVGIATPVSVQNSGIVDQESGILESFEIKGTVETSNREDMHELDVNETAADKILHSAQDEGVDQALMRLADGDFNDEDQEESFEEEKTNLPEIEVSNEEQQALILRVEELENEVVSLKQNMEDSNQALLAFALALYEYVKKEKDEEKKISLIELLVLIMTLFMKKMFIPEGESKNQGLTSAKQSPIEGEKAPTLEKLITILHPRQIEGNTPKAA